MRRSDGRGSRVGAAVISQIAPLALSVLGSQPVEATLTVVDATREVRAEATSVTTVYSCLVLEGQYFLPGCPGSPVAQSIIQTWLAPDWLPFSETALAGSVQAGQMSSIGSDSLSASGSVQFQASLFEELVDDPFAWTFIVDEADASSRADIEFRLDAASLYAISGTARVQYIADVPVHSEVRFLLRLLELPGQSEVERFELPYSTSCPFPPIGTPYCDSGLTPLDLTGELPPGAYRIEIGMLAAGEGGWLPTLQVMPSDGNGQFDVSLARPAAIGLVFVGPSIVDRASGDPCTDRHQLLGKQGGAAERHRRAAGSRAFELLNQQRAVRVGGDDAGAHHRAAGAHRADTNEGGVRRVFFRQIELRLHELVGNGRPVTARPAAGLEDLRPDCRPGRVEGLDAARYDVADAR